MTRSHERGITPRARFDEAYIGLLLMGFMTVVHAPAGLTHLREQEWVQIARCYFAVGHATPLIVVPVWAHVKDMPSSGAQRGVLRSSVGGGPDFDAERYEEKIQDW